MVKSSWTRRKRLQLLARNSKCLYCGTELDLDTSTLEHLLPRSKGGTNHDGNLALACKPCNEKRGNNQRYFVRHKIPENQRRNYQRTGSQPQRRERNWSYYGKGAIENQPRISRAPITAPQGEPQQ